MMMESDPNLKEEVGGSIPNFEISSLLDKFLLGGQPSPVLWRWPVNLLSQIINFKKNKNKNKKD